MSATVTPKRLLICWFSQPHLQAAIKGFLDDYRFDFVGLMASSNYLDGREDVFLNSKETRKRCSFSHQDHKFVPSRDLIEKMRATEAQILKMMDRTFKSPFKPRQYEFRKRFYYFQLCMAYGLIMKHGFDRVIFSNIPHNSFDFILFGLCKAMKIEVSFFYQLQIKDSFLHAHDLEELYDQLVLPAGYIEKSALVLPNYLEGEITDRLETKSPFYMSSNRFSASEKLCEIRKKFFRIQTYTRPCYSISSWVAYHKIPKVIPQEGSRFVYFALHMQPEATTSPMGGVFVDQYYVVLMIARALPEGVRVVVKEHPKQKLWQRSPDFYKILHAEPNVDFVSLKQNSFELIKQSIAVATITGTVGWEALFLKKPVILFGHIFYKNLPGVINVNDTLSLKSAIEQILSGQFKLCRIRDIRSFLLYIHEIAYKGVINDDYFEVSHLSADQSQESVKQALIENIIK